MFDIDVMSRFDVKLTYLMLIVDSGSLSKYYESKLESML